MEPYFMCDDGNVGEATVATEEQFRAIFGGLVPQWNEGRDAERGQEIYTVEGCMKLLVPLEDYITDEATALTAWRASGDGEDADAVRRIASEKGIDLDRVRDAWLAQHARG